MTDFITPLPERQVGYRDTANTEKVAIVFSGTSVHPPVAKDDTLTLKLTNNSVNSAVVQVVLYFIEG